MKIHNYGNDYAFQRKQQSEKTKQASDDPKRSIKETEIKSDTNATDKIQTRGEGCMAVAPQEGAETSEQTIPQEAGKENTKKDKKVPGKAKIQGDSKVQ